MENLGLKHFKRFRMRKFGSFMQSFFLFSRDRKVATRFDQPRLGRNESERRNKWSGIRQGIV